MIALKTASATIVRIFASCSLRFFLLGFARVLEKRESPVSL
jgi:hypothetical protein